MPDPETLQRAEQDFSTPAPAPAGTRRGRAKPSKQRARAVRSVLKRTGHTAAAARKALPRRATPVARKRGPGEPVRSARKAATTKSPSRRRASARKAARTRLRRR
jgi:hypothetical protein